MVKTKGGKRVEKVRVAGLMFSRGLKVVSTRKAIPRAVKVLVDHRVQDEVESEALCAEMEERARLWVRALKRETGLAVRYVGQWAREKGEKGEADPGAEIDARLVAFSAPGSESWMETKVTESKPWEDVWRRAERKAKEQVEEQYVKVAKAAASAGRKDAMGWEWKGGTWCEDVTEVPGKVGWSVVGKEGWTRAWRDVDSKTGGLVGQWTRRQWAPLKEEVKPVARKKAQETAEERAERAKLQLAWAKERAKLIETKRRRQKKALGGVPTGRKVGVKVDKYGKYNKKKQGKERTKRANAARDEERKARHRK